jgi:hypothetical protein
VHASGPGPGPARGRRLTSRPRCARERESNADRGRARDGAAVWSFSETLKPRCGRVATAFITVSINSQQQLSTSGTSQPAPAMARHSTAKPRPRLGADAIEMLRQDVGLQSGVVFRAGAGKLAARSGLRLAAEEEGASMVSAYRIIRDRPGYAVAAFRGEQDRFGPGFVGSLCAAAQSHAGWVPLRGWRYG